MSKDVRGLWMVTKGKWVVVENSGYSVVGASYLKEPMMGPSFALSVVAFKNKLSLVFMNRPRIPCLTLHTLHFYQIFKDFFAISPFHVVRRCNAPSRVLQ